MEFNTSVYLQGFMNIERFNIKFQIYDSLSNNFMNLRAQLWRNLPSKNPNLVDLIQEGSHNLDFSCDEVVRVMNVINCELSTKFYFFSAKMSPFLQCILSLLVDYMKWLSWRWKCSCNPFNFHITLDGGLKIFCHF